MSGKEGKAFAELRCCSLMDWRKLHANLLHALHHGDGAMLWR